MAAAYGGVNLVHNKKYDNVWNVSTAFARQLPLSVKLMNTFLKNTEYFNTRYKIYNTFKIDNRRDIASGEIKIDIP
jgi:hypothetical protein